MKTIEFLDQTTYQIKNILLNDPIIKKLLYVQTPSALSYVDEISNDLVNDLIYVVPYVNQENGIENSGKTNFIIVYPSYINFNTIEDMIDVSIDIFTHNLYYILDNNKSRLNQILDRIIFLLNNKKFSFSEKFKISDARLNTIEDGKIICYLTRWSVVNGTNSDY